MIKSITQLANHSPNTTHSLIFGMELIKLIDLTLTDPTGATTKLKAITLSSAWSICNWFETYHAGQEITIAVSQESEEGASA